MKKLLQKELAVSSTGCKLKAISMVLNFLLAATMLVSVLSMDIPVSAEVLFTTTPMIAAGADHTAALKPDGTVWTWGNNQYGQLGDGTTIRRRTPVQVAGLSGVAAIAAGHGHTVALKSDGTVWTWGHNEYGQLGDGSKTSRRQPVQVVRLSAAIAIAAGEDHTVVVKSDGTVWAFGDNSCKQLGNDTMESSSMPVQIIGLSDVTAVAAGHGHTVALKSNGTVWSCGHSWFGQLGNGTSPTGGKSTPVRALYLSGVSAIAAGFGHTAALKSDGTVWTWGYNYDGQLGDGTSGNGTNSDIPDKLLRLSGISRIAAGADYTAALKSDGTVWAWGNNDYGQLGDDTTSSNGSPVQASGSGYTNISAGENHMAAMKSDGTFWTWGRNNYGQLGNGKTVDSVVPVRVKDFKLYNAVKPIISQQPKNKNVKRKETLTLRVMATTEYGKLSYQWYSNKKKKNKGGKIISKATKAAYKVPTKNKSIIYYYCIVTNTDISVTGKIKATAVSNAAKVTVK